MTRQHRAILSRQGPAQSGQHRSWGRLLEEGAWSLREAQPCVFGEVRLSIYCDSFTLLTLGEQGGGCGGERGGGGSCVVASEFWKDGSVFLAPLPLCLRLFGGSPLPG